ncbi:polyketide cyclase/dehydrase/lipid transport protein [Flavobacterium sp. 1]|uniref:SRPBCC family protein n=1 Tax=Flavobacterium sp. 1 TaxID=2035200 RepID=UPI000C2363D5|nr:SRPBCC family protein [Flavobacterium sp. 1]PJJ09506.1 polyketide cyclase/dehydrase/lipid transport protein [Flavobacterium sp. 1]
MKVLKFIGIGIVGLIALLLIVAMIVPKDYTVSVSTTINKPQVVVFDYVKMIKNQEKYSVWVMKDPNVKIEYTGIDGTVGAKSSWVSMDDNVGVGSQQITKITDNRIDVDLHFEKPMKGDNSAATIVEALSDNQTKLTSEFYGRADYPINLMSFVFKDFIKKDQTQNLANVKNILESQP